MRTSTIAAGGAALYNRAHLARTSTIAAGGAALYNRTHLARTSTIAAGGAALIYLYIETLTLNFFL